MDKLQKFTDRSHAASILADLLVDACKGYSQIVVLGIPRGGVVIASKIAQPLNAELDIMLTRKIRAPFNPELAIGAISENGKLHLNDDVIQSLSIPERYINTEKDYQLNEIQRRSKIYRDKLPKASLEGKTVVLTDDGIATGATMQTAIWAAAAEKPEMLILALPVAPPQTLQKLSKDVDKTICCLTPECFFAVGQFYDNFEQVDDNQVIDILSRYANNPDKY